MNHSRLSEIVTRIIETEITIIDSETLGGGCINTALKLKSSDGHRYVLKINTSENRELFEKEEKGLHLLYNADTSLGVPCPAGILVSGGNSFLLMDYIAPGKKNNAFWEDLGHGLGELHRKNQLTHYGLPFNNHIGLTPQYNQLEEDWITFFANHRLRYQGELALKRGYLTSFDFGELEKLIDSLPEFIPAKPESSLLHGDLWSGNIYCGEGGTPWIIDPAVYYGDRECELAFTRMFGGFSARFYDAYNDYWPLEKGYKERLDLYNLYHYLNHLNLFGRSYYSSVKQIIRKYSKS